jgi:hypothetical protein
METSFDYVWCWKTRLPGRFGQRCRILEVHRLRKDASVRRVRIEFQDGVQAMASAHAIRKYDPKLDDARLDQLSLEF